MTGNKTPAVRPTRRATTKRRLNDMPILAGNLTGGTMKQTQPKRFSEMPPILALEHAQRELANAVADGDVRKEYEWQRKVTALEVKSRLDGLI